MPLSSSEFGDMGQPDILGTWGDLLASAESKDTSLVKTIIFDLADLGLANELCEYYERKDRIYGMSSYSHLHRVY